MKILFLVFSICSFAEVCSYNFGTEKLYLKEPVSKKWKDKGMTYNVNIIDFKSKDNYINVSNGKYKVTYEVNCESSLQ